MTPASGEGEGRATMLPSSAHGLTSCLNDSGFDAGP